MKQKPVHEIKVGGLKATIWVNDNNGKPFYNVTASRNYRADDGWKQTTSFNKAHLAKLSEALLRAEQWIALREPAISQPSA